MPIYALDDDRPVLPEAGRFWIAPDAHVIGKVRLGRGVSIWFGCRACAATTNWSRSAKAPTSRRDPPAARRPRLPDQPLGAGCTVGHHAIVHGCSVGTELAHRHGRHGAQRSADRRQLPRGRQRPRDRGQDVPGRLADRRRAGARGPHLDAAGFERLRRTAQGYVQKWRRYAGGLRRLD